MFQKVKIKDKFKESIMKEYNLCPSEMNAPNKIEMISNIF